MERHPTPRAQFVPPAAAILALTALSGLSLAGGRCLVRPVAVVGDRATGTQGASFSDFSELVSVDEQGRTWFVGTLSGGDTNTLNTTGLWRGDPKKTELVLRAGAPAPGTSQAFSGFGPAAPGPTGACMYAQLGAAGEGSVWTGVSGSLSAAALRGGVPGGVASGILFDSFEGLTSSNDSGQSAFMGYVAGPGIGFSNNQGIWVGSGGATTLFARRGNQIPGAASGVVYSALGFPMLNNSGRVAFTATASGPGVTSSNDQLLAAGSAGQVGVLRREGSQAPGLASGVLFADSSPFSLSDNGDVAFYSVLSGTGVTATNRTSIWLGSSASNVHLAVRAGIPAPGAGSGVIISSLGPSVVLNNLGRIVFPARLSGTGVTSANDQVVCAFEQGHVEIIARDGDAAPGSGRLFSSFSAFGVNDNAQLLFRAALSGGGDGLFLHDPRFGMVEICRVNAPLHLGPGDDRTVQAIGATFDAAPGDGRWTQLSSVGHIACAARFTDGTAAILVASVGCTADFNLDTQVDVFDYIDFVNAFMAEDESSDITGDGSIDFFDYLEFVDAFSSGC